MGKVDDIIAAEEAELEHAELPDRLPADVRVDRPNANRSRNFSVRLRDAEVDALTRIAQEKGLPPRTLARSWLLDRIAAEKDGEGEDLARRVARLERSVATLVDPRSA